MHRNNVRHTVVEAVLCRVHEPAHDFIALGTGEVDLLQRVVSSLCLMLWMGTPTWMRVSQVLATTVARNPFGACLLWRTVGIFDAYRALLTIFDERQPVQPVHKISRHGNSQDCMRLLELALDNLNLHALDVALGVLRDERADVLHQPFVSEVSVQVAYPQHKGRISTHIALLIAWHRFDLFWPFCGPSSGFQHHLKHVAPWFMVFKEAWRLKLDNVERQDLKGRRNHIVACVRNPDVIAITVIFVR
mmetsp:Transcript_27331/g.52704  ORF Transcript_27331/g.52704 Transcript_27331/m.52704 type:complete len:247 (+) Transcript_27331:780-1520(+)